MSTHRHAVPPRLPPAAVVYGPRTADRSLLARFARELRERGFRVGGLVQAASLDGGGAKIGFDAIEVDTGRRIPISRPTASQRRAGECGLDTAALADASGALRRAVAERMDLVVVEKFGDQESSGGGFADELLAAMAEGLPTIASVPAAALEDWNLFSGGLGELLPYDEAALWRWWGPHRLYEDLVRGVGEAPARRVIAGPVWTIVEGPEGCGAVPTPGQEGNAGASPSNAAGLTGRPLSELARMLLSWDPFEAAVGLAAVNAHYNRYDLEESTESDLGGFEACGELLVEAAWRLADKEGALIEARGLVDHGLPTLLAAKGLGSVALAGPGTPLTPRLFTYGIAVLSGLVIEDPQGAAALAACGEDGNIERHARPLVLAVLRSPEDQR